MTDDEEQTGPHRFSCATVHQLYFFPRCSVCGDRANHVARIDVDAGDDPANLQSRCDQHRAA